VGAAASALKKKDSSGGQIAAIPPSAATAATSLGGVPVPLADSAGHLNLASQGLAAAAGAVYFVPTGLL
jgi:hypothetical protein